MASPISLIRLSSIPFVFDWSLGTYWDETVFVFQRMTWRTGKDKSTASRGKIDIANNEGKNTSPYLFFCRLSISSSVVFFLLETLAILCEILNIYLESSERPKECSQAYLHRAAALTHLQTLFPIGIALLKASLSHWLTKVCIRTFWWKEDLQTRLLWAPFFPCRSHYAQQQGTCEWPLQTPLLQKLRHSPVAVWL